MGRTGRRVGALVCLLLVTILVEAYLELQVPRWVAVWIEDGFALLFFAVLLALARRWWWPDRPPADRSALQADPAVPLPGPGSARRLVVAGSLLTLVALLVTAGFVLATVAWARGNLTATADDGPLWYRSTMLVGGSIGMTVLSVAAAYAFFGLRRAIARVSAGQEPRWTATVIRHGLGTVTLSASPTSHPEQEPRLVRINAAGCPQLVQSHAGDEFLIDGSLRRGDYVAVHDDDRPRWVTATWRQPRTRSPEPTRT